MELTSSEPVASPLLAAPANAPREITAIIRRRAWTEPRVRLWWMLSLGVLLLTLYVSLTEAAAWWKERRLLTHGVAVQAVIIRAVDRLNDIPVPNKQMPPDSVCTLTFTLNGTEYTVQDQLKEHIERGQHVVTGPEHPITIHVDPEDPTRWTDRTSAPPLLSRQLIGVSVGVPTVAVLAILAVAKQKKLLEVWRTGDASTAIVLSLGQTPIAPGARAVRCTPADHADKRVFAAYLPAGAGTVAPGDVLWIIHPIGRSDRGYAAIWFDRPGEKSS